MSRLFVVVVMLLVVALAVALVGPSLPEGNPLRTVGDGLQGIGEFVGSGFGGGYGQLPQGG